MREIRFRAIDEFTDDFIYAPAFFVDRDNNQGYLAYGISDHHLVKKNTVGQFTGLKDKNSVEIYEGDIITTQNYTMYGGKRRVFWDKSLLAFAFDKHLVSPILLCHAIGIEIIGNIHQNPELLKK